MQTDISKTIEQVTAAIGEPAARYDGLSIVLHWLTAVLVLGLWTLGQTIDFFAKGTPRIDARSVHIVLGATLAGVLIARVLWRTSAGRKLPLASADWIGMTARATHYGLYLLLVTTIVLGVLNAWQRGDILFNVNTIPKLVPGDLAFKRTIEDLHGDFADVVLIVAGLHAAAALAHHSLLRDSVLRRMLPSWRPNA
ncbi:MAG TPA: cytochrome b/b6 domain-containing protein [Steroidobacteraceae bacterium]|nr:cytochrome b/b6 domain-containing protein [Steroidobacteraceae bacterium]